MEITQQADYAVRTVLELALHQEGECVVSSEVAHRQSIPAPFLAKIVARLAAADSFTVARPRFRSDLSLQPGHSGGTLKS